MRALAVILLACLPPVASAQEVLGQSVINGRDITIYADGTWEFASPGTSDCDQIARGVEFCGDNAIWESTTPPNNDIAATYRFDDRHYGQMIIEELGTEDGITQSYMRATVIENAAMVLGGTTKDVQVIETYPSRVAGRTAETVVYAFNIDGLDVVYANGIFTSPRRTMQLMTFAIGNRFTEMHRDLHDDFLAEITIAK